MKKTILIACGLVVAVLLGRYGIPSRDKLAAPAGSMSTSSVAARSAARGAADAASEQDVRDGSGMSVPQARTGVFINDRELTREQVLAIAATYHYAPVPGKYWYDTASGAWGFSGHETAGFLMPGHNFGPMSPRASAGDTGVFINGRELNLIETLRIRQTFGAVYQGRWWLDGRTGNFGMEGNSMPMGNMIGLLQQRQNGRSGDNFWCGATGCGNDNGKSGYVDAGGAVVGYDR